MIHSWPRRSGKTTECARLCRELNLPYYCESDRVRMRFREEYPDIIVLDDFEGVGYAVIESCATNLKSVGDYILPVVDLNKLHLFGTFGNSPGVDDYRRCEDIGIIECGINMVKEDILSLDLFYSEILNI